MSRSQIGSSLLLFLLALSTILTQQIEAADQGSALSYQGRLNFSGSPANGSYDFLFTLWDAATEGNLVAGPISKNALPVASGQFATALDFGLSAFSGGARWVEVSVRPAG